jgi:outer membrane protein OmpA-like peptidoglycan-associated protein
MYLSGIYEIEPWRRLEGWFFSITTVLICLLVGASFAVGDENKEFRVIRFQHEIDLGDGISGSAGPDYLINGGESDGLKVSMLLDVYRPRNIHDPFNNKEYPLKILIGQVKVIRVFPNLAVTRLHALELSTEKPIVEYRSVMIGDYARLRPPGAAKPATFSLPSNVLFDFDSWQIKPDAQAALLTISEMLKRNPGYGLAIEGHTCNLGSAQYNKILSLKRAAGVAAFIVSYGGIRRERIHFFGYGEASPVASNDTEKGRQQNRRVDFRLIPPGAPIPVI